MSMMSNALAWAAQQRKAHAAETGTIRRGASETANISMTVGKTMADIEGDRGVTVRVNIADFLITAADYTFSSVVSEPQRGDEIEYGGKKYQAMPISGGEVWRYAENVNRTTLRIHTKEVGDVI